MIPGIWKLIVVAAVLGLGLECHAQTPGRVDLDAAEMIGAPVFAADGPQIGEVADVVIDDDGQIGKIRFTTGAVLGFGPRTIELPKGAYIALRGAVVIDTPAEAAQLLPEATDPAGDK